jgi:hypothetical protein
MQEREITENTEPVSTIVKHIKIYSDNPIHDAIDRIINSCVGLDRDDENRHYHAINLKDSVEELFILAAQKSELETYLYVAKMNEETPD